MGDYELYHHGVKGQKWGIRRTAAQLGHRIAKAAGKAGKATSKAVGKGAKIAKKAAVAQAKKSYKEHKEKAYYKKLHKKKLSQMTDKEIKDLTKRVQVEATLKGAKYESRVQNARKFYNNVAKQPVNDIISKYAQAAIKDAFKDNKKEAVNTASENKSISNKTFNQKVSKLKDKVNSRDNTKVSKGSSNTFNNPVIIRHGGN